MLIDAVVMSGRHLSCLLQKQCLNHYEGDWRTFRIKMRKKYLQIGLDSFQYLLLYSYTAMQCIQQYAFPLV